MTDPVLAAREERWKKKLGLAGALAIRCPQSPASLAALTLRMPAPLRTSGRFCDKALALHASFAGVIRGKGIAILHEEFRVSSDGPESCIAAALDPVAFKRLAVDWETDHPWGDVADLDIMGSDGMTVSRTDLGLPSRKCLVCGEEAVVCSAGRRHDPALLEARVEEILRRPEAAATGPDQDIGRLALTAALYEASAAPKPGLVDPASRGAHRDMDYLSFLSSAAALGPWFTEFARLGRASRGEAADPLPALREAGKAAERDMFAATGGINTHKGLIFSLGLLCAAAGRLASAGVALGARACADEAATIVRGISGRELGTLSALAPGSPRTVGERLYRQLGVRGIRGEAEDGFPAVIGHALPRLRAGLSAGMSWNDSMVDSLLVLYTIVEDTNVLGRTGREGLSLIRAEAGQALGLGGMASAEGRAAIMAMDGRLTDRNISPGGCADLLAVAVFLEKLESSATAPPASPAFRP